MGRLHVQATEHNSVYTVIWGLVMCSKLYLKLTFTGWLYFTNTNLQQQQQQHMVHY